jgi:hypothetical protein
MAKKEPDVPNIKENAVPTSILPDLEEDINTPEPEEEIVHEDLLTMPLAKEVQLFFNPFLLQQPKIVNSSPEANTSVPTKKRWNLSIREPVSEVQSEVPKKPKTKSKKRSKAKQRMKTNVAALEGYLALVAAVFVGLFAVFVALGIIRV